MRLLEASELADLERYARLRDDYRRSVIAHKRSRRMPVGDRVTLVFEDRETLRFQVQEMLFVERIRDPARVQDELDIYNELMPRERELSATLFIEITELREIRPELDRLIGLDEHVSLVIGAGARADRVAADFDRKQLEEDRLSAVQYIRFRLAPAQAERFADPAVPAAIQIGHPAYDRSAEIPPDVRDSLIRGLRADPAPLLAPGAPPPPERVLFETPNVRAVERTGLPARRAVVVEARGAAPLSDALWRELCDALRRAAEEVAASAGRARIQADWGADGWPPRWHVVSIDDAG
jgi:hypothetical protein